MNKWLKNLLAILAIFSFSYYLILAIVDGYFLGITLLWVLIGIICVGLVVLDSKGKFPKVNKAISTIILILVFLFAGYALFNLGFILLPKEKIQADKIDYIILLGGGLKANGTPSNSVKIRIDTASILWKNFDKKCKVVVTGGQIYPAPFPESQMLERELEKRGVPVEFILQDDKALDTIQNLKNAAILLSEKENKSLEEILNSNIVIVSSDYHLSRSLWIAKRLGYKNVFGFGSETANYAILNSYLREILAVAKLHLRILFTGEPKLL
jgi:uncharacterized SAM-binding protein YcdF (DUF218 family)